MNGEKRIDLVEEIKQLKLQVVALEVKEMERLREHTKFLLKCNDMYREAMEKIAKNHDFDVIKDAAEIVICSQELSEKTLKEAAFLEYDYIQFRDGKKK